MGGPVMTGLLTLAELGCYQRLLRPVLFRLFQGDPEAIHEAMSPVCRSQPRSQPSRNHP